MIERLSQDSIVEALTHVPHDFRDVLVLVDIGEFSYADAAQILDIPIGTVMSRLHRARRILKGELAEEVVELSGYAFDPCERCEEMMQPYLDRDLTTLRCARPRRTSTAAPTAGAATASRSRCVVTSAPPLPRADAAGAEGKLSSSGSRCTTPLSG